VKVIIDRDLLRPHEVAVVLDLPSVRDVYRVMRTGRLAYLLEPNACSPVVPDFALESFLADEIVASAVAVVEASEAAT
jgi:hypothetical protein